MSAIVRALALLCVVFAAECTYLDQVFQKARLVRRQSEPVELSCNEKYHQCLANMNYEEEHRVEDVTTWRYIVTPQFWNGLCSDVGQANRCLAEAVQGVCSDQTFVEENAQVFSRMETFICNSDTAAKWAAMGQSQCIINASLARTALSNNIQCQREFHASLGPNSNACQLQEIAYNCIENGLREPCGPAFGIFFRAVVENFHGILTDVTGC